MRTRSRQEGWRLQWGGDSLPREPGTRAVIQCDWPGLKTPFSDKGPRFCRGALQPQGAGSVGAGAAAPLPVAPAPRMVSSAQVPLVLALACAWASGPCLSPPAPPSSSLLWQDQLSTSESPVGGKDPQALTVGASVLGFHEALGGDGPQRLRHSPALRAGGCPPGPSLPGLGAAEAPFGGGGGWRFRGKRSKGWGGWHGRGLWCALHTPPLTVLVHQHPSPAHPGARAGGALLVPSYCPSHPAVIKGTYGASAAHVCVCQVCQAQGPQRQGLMGHAWRGYVALSGGASGGGG